MNTQPKTLKLAVLGSTNGSDLTAIIEGIRAQILNDISIEIVISNRKGAGILKKAHDAGIPNKYLPKFKSQSRAEYGNQLQSLLADCGVDYILLIGWMMLLSSSFVNGVFHNRIINIHPSLLPAFAGGMDTNVHQAVLDRGCKVTGATLMFVDEGADTGPIIAQRVCVVADDDTVDILKSRVQQCEQEIFLEVLPMLRDRNPVIKGSRVIFE